MASGAVAQDKILIGQPMNFDTSACATEADMREIVAYSKAHDGDGYTEFLKKKAEGLCGHVITSPNKTTKITRVLERFNDKVIGDTYAVEFVITNGDKTLTLYGLIGPDAFDPDTPYVTGTAL